MDRELEKYILDHSTTEDPVLEDLYRQTHLRFVNPNMACGHLQGKFIEMISRMVNPSFILEIGTFTGYSAICLAKGLKNDGILITIEPNDELAGFNRSYFTKAGVGSKIKSITGRLQDVAAMNLRAGPEIPRRIDTGQLPAVNILAPDAKVTPAAVTRSENARIDR